MHIARIVLGDVVRRVDTVTFVLQQRSLFRIRVPNHEQLDIDFTLFNGTRANIGPSVFSRTGWDDENALYVLQTGPYYLEFRIRRRGGITIKPVRDHTLLLASMSAQSASLGSTNA